MSSNRDIHEFRAIGAVRRLLDEALRRFEDEALQTLL